MEDCIFCKIIKGEIPSTKVYEDDKVFAFRDIEPHAPVHVLIVPKTHLTNLSEVGDKDKELLGHILLVSKSIAESEKVSEAFKLTTNSGQFAGQVVMHMHFHLLGGWKTKDEVKSELHQ